MYRILKESNIQALSTVSKNPEAQDILAALKELRQDSRSLHLGRPSHSAVAAGSLKDGLRMQVDELPVPPQNEYRHGSGYSPTTHPTTSSLQPSSMYMPPHFGSAHSDVASIPTLAHHSYPPAPYRSLEFAHPMQMHMHPQLLAAQLSQDEMVRHECLASWNGVLQMPEPWRSSPSSLTPSTNTPLGGGSDHQSTLAGSPGTYSGEPIHKDMHMHQSTHFAVEQPPWNWGGGSDMNFYPNS